ASLARWRAKRRGIEGHFLVSHSTALARALDLDRARRGSEFTEWDGKAHAAAGRSRQLAVGGVLSASRLEKWARCPFGYYLTYVLRLSVLETPEEITAISALDRGTLMHSILERLVRESGVAGDLPDYGLPWNDRHVERALAIAEDEFGQAEARGITGRALLWDAAKEEMRQDLMLFLDEDSRARAVDGLRPHRVEFRFGFNQAGSLSPIELKLPGGVTLRFRGAVDRIDVDASGSRAMITDYKSGSAFTYRDMGKDPLGKGKHLQLPVYALAVRAAMGDAVDVSAQYWFISSRAGFVRREVNLAKEEGRFRQVVAAIASGIQAGVFPAHPGGPGRDQPENCGYCGFLRICPSDKDALWERKMASPELAAYTGLLEDAPGGEDEE
ncbi:MAG: PD-(D/E)XK nuclease family protein, partial [Dehalococcoidia bacterium]|nr:PD-(D/E)XK nuclease family protein [Dehalococcoidia bacterium]